MKFGIIGLGNLGGSLASGLIKSGSAMPENIYVCEKSESVRSRAERDFGMHASDDINYVIKNSDAVFLTVKSRVFDELSASIDKALLAGKTVISFMAGVPFEKIYSLIGRVSLVRAMPSLAISSCDGVIGYTSAPAEISEIFHKLGYAFETAPENIEKVMAFSSCGLGFAAYLIDAFASAGAGMGFSPEDCVNIAAITFKNAAQLGGFKDTVKSVATPGGATEQGVLHMDECGVHDIVARAVEKAYERMK